MQLADRNWVRSRIGKYWRYGTKCRRYRLANGFSRKDESAMNAAGNRSQTHDLTAISGYCSLSTM
jgi:hypothetical protein